MRPRAKLVLEPSELVYARCVGMRLLGDVEIRVSTAAVDYYSRYDLDAVLTHEQGHYQLYHAEQQAGLYLAYICSIIGLFSGDLQGLWLFLLQPLFRLWWELQADRYSTRAGYNMKAVLCDMLAHFRFKLSARLMLMIRILNLK